MFKLCIVESNFGCISLGYGTMYCAVGEYRSSMLLRNVCNTYCKTTKCRDPSNHKRNFQRSGNLESLLKIPTAENWYAGSAEEAILLLNFIICVSTAQEQINYCNRWARHRRKHWTQRNVMACLRTETRRSASRKISPTSGFRVHKVEVDKSLMVGKTRMELQFHPGLAVRKLSTNLYDIYHCWVYSE